MTKPAKPKTTNVKGCPTCGRPLSVRDTFNVRVQEVLADGKAKLELLGVESCRDENHDVADHALELESALREAKFAYHAVMDDCADRREAWNHAEAVIDAAIREWNRRKA